MTPDTTCPRNCLNMGKMEIQQQNHDNVPGTGIAKSIGNTFNTIPQAAGKSCELDPVPSWVIQKFADELSPFVAALFNASMSSGSFPTSQMTASITPVLKKVTLDPYDLSNYRPFQT